ncbi:YaiI/YqxD family protein [Methylocella sp.]|uniref:YaiI/YqxD family protein n=1 Tax=Methylocella sp. TaxID=1978226 RepID=UPI003C2241DE
MPAPSEQAPPDAAQGSIAIYVDADACPVKPEIYRVAERHRLKVFVVANSFIATPRENWIERVVVEAAPDAADDWIAARAARGAIVVTADVPLASRCIKAGADVIAPVGKAFTDSSIGLSLATRNLFDDLRAQGDIIGGPKPFSPRDRSAFLSALDLAIVRLRRSGFKAPDLV